MEIKQFLTPYNYTKSDNKKNEFIVVHYTANNGDTAKGNCNYFSKGKVCASAHYFVDEKSIYQCVLDKNIAWHIGGASIYYNRARNENSIGVELCSRKNLAGYYFKEETVKNALELVAYLMVKYNIKSSNVVRHFDCTHKNCPAPFVENVDAWQQFKENLYWIDYIINLKEKGRLNKAEDWLIKAFEKDSELKYVFMKWSADVDKIPSS